MLKDFKNLIKALQILILHLFELLGNIIVKILVFMGPVTNSVKNVINPEEFYRVIVLAISGSGSFYGFFEYIKNHYQEFVTDPNVSIGMQAFIKHCQDKHLHLAIFAAIFLGDYCRRKYIHGDHQ